MENPIAFAETRTIRALSMAHLHARYAGLLLAPVQLSADWSFDCIPLVESLSDPRNLLSLALYAWLLWTALAAKPWRVAAELWLRLAGGHPLFKMHPWGPLCGARMKLRGSVNKNICCDLAAVYAHHDLLSPCQVQALCIDVVAGIASRPQASMT